MIRRLVSNYQTVVTQGQPLILMIVVTEIVPQNKQSQTNVRSSE
jgi:hypothetical protein